MVKGWTVGARLTASPTLTYVSIHIHGRSRDDDRLYGDNRKIYDTMARQKQRSHRKKRVPGARHGQPAQQSGSAPRDGRRHIEMQRTFVDGRSDDTPGREQGYEWVCSAHAPKDEQMEQY
jgi:hypothetical protein